MRITKYFFFHFQLYFTILHISCTYFATYHIIVIYKTYNSKLLFIICLHFQAVFKFTTFVYPGEQDVIRDIEICSYDVQVYLQNVTHWPSPIMPLIPGCPPATREPTEFHEEAPSKWWVTLQENPNPN